MPEFPIIDHCIICEEARLELGAKLSILGFFGIAPDVQITLEDLTKPVQVLLLFIGKGGEGDVAATANLLDKDGEILSSSLLRGNIDPTRDRIIMGSYFRFPFHRGGKVSIQIVDEQQIIFQSYFMVAQGVPPSPM